MNLYRVKGDSQVELGRSALTRSRPWTPGSIRLTLCLAFTGFFGTMWVPQEHIIPPMSCELTRHEISRKNFENLRLSTAISNMTQCAPIYVVYQIEHANT